MVTTKETSQLPSGCMVSVTDDGFEGRSRDFRNRIVHGCTIKVIGRWEPTTQTCSVCGTPGGKKPLSVRVWTCEGCNTVLDRDYNAAVNILVAGGLSETLNACGPDVRRLLAGAVGDEAGTHRTTTVDAAPAA